MCSVLVNKLRPSRTVAEALPNAAANQRVKDLVAARHAVITRSGRTYDTIYFTLPSFPGVEISAARRYVIVMAPGHVDAIWTHFDPAAHAPIVPDLPPIVAATQTIGDDIFFAQNRAAASPHAAVVLSHCKVHRSRLWLLCAQGHHRAAQEWCVWLRANQKTEVLASWRTGGRDATIL